MSILNFLRVGIFALAYPLYYVGADPVDYMLTIPSALTAGTSQKACVTLHRHYVEETGVNIEVILHGTNKTNVYDSFATELGVGRPEVCFHLEVPKIDLPEGTKMKIAGVTIDIYVQMTDYEITSTKQLLIYPPDLDVYINTDKPLYKPGQIVLFRILQLEGLYPSGHPIETIDIIDPKGRTLMVFENREPTLGLVSEKFQLVAEPTEGIWNLEVELAGKQFSTTFEVKEYVLPKYEVTFETPDYIHVEEESFSIKICGKYTYGKPVRGAVSAEISISPEWNWGSQRPRQHILAQTDETGCAVIEGSPEVLQFRNNRLTFHDMRLKVTASITEELTGISISGENSDCKLTTMPYVLRTENTKDYFNPGLPYKFEIYYADVSGIPIPGRELMVKVRGKTDLSTHVTYFNQTTDDNGKITIAMETDAVTSYYDFEVFDPSTPGLASNWWEDDQQLSIRRDSRYWRARQKLSPSFSYLEIDTVEKDKIVCFEHMTITGKALVSYQSEDEAGYLNIYYRVVARDNIIGDGKAVIGEDTECLEVEYPMVNSSTLRYSCYVSFTFQILTQDWMPDARVLVYLINEGDVIADDITISSECFLNEADLQMNSRSVRPGENLELTVKSSPNSLCALSVVDKSVHLLGGDNSLTKEKVKSGLTDAERRGLVYIDEECSTFKIRFSVDEDDYATDNWDYRRKRRDTSSDSSVGEAKRRRRSSIPLVRHPSAGDSVYKSFKNSRLLFITNLEIASDECRPIAIAFRLASGIDGEPVLEDRVAFDSVGESVVSTEQEDVIQVRNYFPETWKWELIETGEEGIATFVEEMPDTITEWVATSYCLSAENGIGISNIGRVKGFKPVFLSMSLPYSVIRGEEITIKSALFNYLEKDVCLEMVINLDQSDDFELLEEGPTTTYKCICGGDATSVQYNIRPLKLGEISITMKTWSRDGHLCGKEVKAHLDATDGVERTLLVEPEGIEEENTANDFLCIEDSETSSMSLSRSIIVPLNHYEGSARVLINVIGSVMGPVLDNLEDLVQMPYGCGEQNMVTMVPNIVVMKYLKAIEELTPDVEEVIKNNIMQGYQRQLNYQRTDGSFSAFGDRDSAGSTWLTAFVISTFNQAKDYIFVDDQVISRASNFIDANRGENGCVKKVGVVHHKGMMGGVDGPNALNAYIELALHHPGDTLIPDSPQDISGCDGSTNIKLYTRALKFYTSCLEGKWASARLLWSGLKSDARLEVGSSFEEAKSIFWSDEEPKEETEGADSWWHYQKPSDAVEVTGYVLLGYLELEKTYPDEFPIMQAYPIVHWMTLQRNAHGGFSSTQNTVIGITSLSSYAARTFVPDTDMTVSVHNDTQSLATFSLADESTLVTHQTMISPPLPLVMNYAASGVGCALIQTNVKYNIPRKEVEPSFTVSVNIRGLEKGCDSLGTRLVVVCATYKGTHERPVSNMAVFEVKLVSGFKPNTASLKKMIDNNKENGLKRYEIDGKKVIVYFRAISSLRKCAAFEVTHEEEVKNIQPGIVRVYDYYDPTKESTTLYTMSCTWENYNPADFMADCVTWGDHGFCTETCLSRRSSECAVSQKIDKAVDYCAMFGDSVCGTTGDCRSTSTYYRCSCHDGYKKTRWGNSCIPEDEEEEDLQGESPPFLQTTPPDCEEGKPCPRGAVVLSEGNTTLYFCIDGYNLIENGEESYCEDIDECVSKSCNSNFQVCKNVAGDYDCACKEGYKPFNDPDENIEEPFECIKTESLNEPEQPELEIPKIIPLVPVVDSETVEVIPDIIPPPPDDLLSRCPTCLNRFPKADKQRDLFCPKENVFVLTNATSGTSNLRAIVRHGESTYGDLIRGVKLMFDKRCTCSNLLDDSLKSLMFTPHDVTSDGDSYMIIVDDVATITPKRAWKKVQRYVCERDVVPVKAGLNRGD